MSKVIPVATEKANEGTPNEVETQPSPSHELPSTPLYRACDKIWEVLERLSANNQGIDLNDELVRDLYETMWHLTDLAGSVDDRVERDAWLHEKSVPPTK